MQTTIHLPLALWSSAVSTHMCFTLYITNVAWWDMVYWPIVILISNIRGSQPWATHSCRRGSHVGVQLPLWFSVRQAPQQNKHYSSWCERNGARFTDLGCYISKKNPERSYRQLMLELFCRFQSAHLSIAKKKSSSISLCLFKVIFLQILPW